MSSPYLVASRCRRGSVANVRYGVLPLSLFTADIEAARVGQVALSAMYARAGRLLRAALALHASLFRSVAEWLCPLSLRVERAWRCTQASVSEPFRPSAERAPQRGQGARRGTMP